MYEQQMRLKWFNMFHMQIKAFRSRKIDNAIEKSIIKTEIIQKKVF
mgnify:FL=1